MMKKLFILIFDIVRLLGLFILFPVLLLLIGPILIVATVMGDFSIGMVTLNPGRSHPRDRIFVFLMGVIVWGVTWCGIALFFVSNPNLLANLPFERFSNWAGTTVSNFSAPPLEVPKVPPTVPVVPIETPTAIITSTPEQGFPTPIPSPTPTPTLVTPVPTNSPQVETKAPTVTLTLLNPFVLLETEVVEALAQANDLLVEVLQNPTVDNLARLEGPWQDEALLEVQNFAQQIGQRYESPVFITYTPVGTPTILIDETRVEATIQLREFWVFQDATRRKESFSQYEYRLRQEADTWIVWTYRFDNLPLTDLPEAIIVSEPTEVISPDTVIDLSGLFTATEVITAIR